MMPPNDERRNPFEDHIQSELFDMSELSVPLDPARLEEQIQTLLNTLPQPLDYRLWDEELDDAQKQLCAHLSAALIERYIRPNYPDEFREMGDDDLLVILTVPLALAMLVQQRLYTPPQSTAPARVSELAARPNRPTEYNAPTKPFAPLPTELPQRVLYMAQRMVTIVQRLLFGKRR